MQQSACDGAKTNESSFGKIEYDKVRSKRKLITFYKVLTTVMVNETFIRSSCFNDVTFRL